MLGFVGRLNPFKTPEARRLALLFGVVYFAQGMWSLPAQSITIVLKDRGLGPAQIADFFLLSTIPWLIKPAYGLLSDFVPLFGRRRKSYFLLTCGLAAGAGLVLASGVLISRGPIHTYDLGITLFGTRYSTGFTLVAGVGLFTLMALGLAFTDVLTDAMMVEHGRPRGLTGAFQSVQWACITVASVLVGVGAGFILFWTFSPSFGPAFLYYQTDTLGFSQQFIGTLGSLAAAAGVVGAAAYAPLSRRVRLKTLVNLSIGIGVAATLAYLVYRDATSAIVIDTLFGGVGMLTQLAFLDLAAKSCPRRVEATFFALLMSVYNGGGQLSQNVGARLYDGFGYTPLVLISAGMTALAWLLVPLVRIDRIEALAREEAAARDAAAAAASSP